MFIKKLFWFYGLTLFFLASCGPVVISSRPHHPPPPWFYPNRLEVVRYVYFPEYHIYFDLSTRNYLYLDGGIWISVNTLPLRYRIFDPKRSRYVRIRDYHDDNIGRYHNDRYTNRGRSNRNTPKK